MMPKKNLLIFLSLAALASAVAFAIMFPNKINFKSLNNVDLKQNANPATEGATSKQNLNEGVQQGDYPIPENIPQGVSVASFKAKAGTQTTASAMRVVEGDKLAIAIETTLKEPDSGKVYVAWISKDSTNYKLGEVKKAGDKYIISTTLSKDYSTYNNILISLENSLDAEKPGEIILQGSF